MNLIGRDNEINILARLYRSESPEFLALYGRRRIGKTFLIKEFFKTQTDHLFFDVAGTKGATTKKQIKHFTDRLAAAFYNNMRLEPGKNWDDAFIDLTKAIKDQVPANKKIVLFFDELPWMATPRSKLLETLDYYWNQHWSQDSRIKLVICGSSASWIINNIIKNRGGLHNRITCEIHLEPFNLSETKKFLQLRNISLSDRQILQLYMVFGGIPFYLNKIEPGLSITQIIEQLSFSKTGFFLEEFDKLFSSLFDNSDEYIALVKLLAENRYGIGERKLLEKLGKKAIGAKGKKMLNNLEQTGFIARFKPLYNKRRGTYYRLIDEYTFFYLKWIKPIKSYLIKQSLEPNYWQSIQKTPGWYAWLGYAFESVCYKHIINIKKALGLNHMALPSSWRYVPNAGSENQGAQIDLLFDRQDDTITLCEIKNTEEPFILTKEYTQTLLQKVAVFKEHTKTNKHILIALISANGLKESYYAEGLITKVVTLEDLFDQ